METEPNPHTLVFQGWGIAVEPRETSAEQHEVVLHPGAVAVLLRDSLSRVPSSGNTAKGRVSRCGRSRGRTGGRGTTARRRPARAV